MEGTHGELDSSLPRAQGLEPPPEFQIFNIKMKINIILTK